MGKIDDRLTAAAYDLARQVKAGRKTGGEAVDELVRDHGMNRSSATTYVRNLSDMLDGRLFKRGMSAPSVAVYFERIAEDYGGMQLLRAISSVRQNISYNRQTKGVELRAVSLVCDAAEAKLPR